MIPDLFKRGSRKRKDPYISYYYPLAIIRLKQGFGRLIRNKTDRGIFVIFDKRLKNSVRFSGQFLSSLPFPIKNTHKYLPFKESLNAIEKFYSKYTIKQLSVAKAILQLVEEWNGKLPRSSIAKILRGTTRKYDPEAISLFGIFSNYCRYELMDYINNLIREGYLAQTGGRTSKVIITNKGKLFLTNQTKDLKEN